MPTITSALTLSERSMSGFPVSVGTGLALETIFSPTQDVIDPDRKAPPKIVKDSYNLYLINAATIIRNLLSSLPYKDLVLIKYSDILDTLLTEIEYLTSLFETQSLNLKIYHNTYDVPTITHKDKLRLITTEQQKHIQDITYKCLKYLKSQDDTDVFRDKVSYGKTDTALMISHVPWDFLSHTNFSKLDMLESHTGVVKSRKDWYTKYFKIPDKDMSFLPLLESLLIVFGDTVMFKPDKISVRQELLQKLLDKNTHPLMSEQTLKYLNV